MTLVPAVAPSVLSELVRDRGDGHVFFTPGAPAPQVIPSAAFGPVSHRALREVSAVLVHAERPEDTEPPLPLMQYDVAHRFPLWGVPGKTPPSVPEPETEADES